MRLRSEGLRRPFVRAEEMEVGSDVANAGVLGGPGV